MVVFVTKVAPVGDFIRLRNLFLWQITALQSHLTCPHCANLRHDFLISSGYDKCHHRQVFIELSS